MKIKVFKITYLLICIFTLFLIAPIYGKHENNVDGVYDLFEQIKNIQKIIYLNDFSYFDSLKSDTLLLFEVYSCKNTDTVKYADTLVASLQRVPKIIKSTFINSRIRYIIPEGNGILKVVLNVSNINFPEQDMFIHSDPKNPFVYKFIDNYKAIYDSKRTFAVYFKRVNAGFKVFKIEIKEFC